jgi:hypothetical protein
MGFKKKVMSLHLGIAVKSQYDFCVLDTNVYNKG